MNLAEVVRADGKLQQIFEEALCGGFHPSMEQRVRGANAMRVLAIAAASWLLGATGSAVARPVSDQIIAEVPWTSGGYFIDFRARPSSYIGHTYIVYGRLDAQGGVV